MEMDDIITNIKHVGYIVYDLEKSVDMFKQVFNINDENIKIIPEEQTHGIVAFAFLKFAGTEIELTHPASDYFKEMTGNPAEGINHVAFEVKNIEQAIKTMQRRGFDLGYISNDLGIFDTGDSKIVYLDPNKIGGNLIELVEVKTK